MPLAIALHLLAAVVWIGGMFFAYIVLRPAAAQLLEPPLRLSLWLQVFKRFFPWVWMALLILVATGLWMVIAVFGGMAAVGVHVHLMIVIGSVMIALFLWVYFGHLRRLREAITESNWPAGGATLNRIRRLIGINLTLGLLLVVIVGAGRYLV